MEENLVKKETEVASNNNNSSKNGIIAILIVIIIALIGVGVYFAFIKKDNSQTNNQNDNTKDVVTDKIEFKQVKSSYIGDVYLDTDGRTYLSLSKEESGKGWSIVQSFIDYYNKTSKKYTNIVKNNIYNSDSIEALDLNIDGIDGIDYLTIIPDNMDCYTFLTFDGRLFLLNPVTISSEGKIELIKPNVLQHDIDSVGTDNKGAYAMNSYNNKIYISDAIDGDIQEVEITDKSQDIKVNGKVLKIKIIGKNDGLNGDLYVNDKVIHTFDYDHVSVYVLDKYLLIVWQGGQCLGAVKLGAINENGEYISIDSDSAYVNIYDIHSENGKVLAKAQISDDYDLCGPEVKVELTYDEKNVIIKKAK